MPDSLRIAFTGRLRPVTERGASAVSYGLAIAGVCAVLALAAVALGPIVRSAGAEPCDPAVEARCTP